jgi:L-amino acid N-acyltransferase YncA
MRLRLARVDDADAILAIYNAEVAGSTNTFDMVARSKADQLDWLAHHQGAHPALVAVADPEGREDQEHVLGFGSLSPYKDRAAYATTVEDSIYVDQAARGQGVGRALLVELITLAADHGFHSIIARIVGHNEVSIGLHQACGFAMVGIEKEVGRKHRQWLDVVELQRML